MRLPGPLYTATQTRELDRLAIAAGTDGYALMCRAGSAACRALRLRWPAPRRVAVVCGAGNNGGDGFVMARLLRAEGVDVSAGLLGEAARVGGDAGRALADWQASGGQVQAAADLDLERADLIVDALFGTGLQRPVSGAAAALVQRMNAAAGARLAVDVPSGLSSDTGAVLGTAVRADLTVTFIALKQGLFTGAAADHVGTLAFDDLGVALSLLASVIPAAQRVGDTPPLALPAAARSAHKGEFGHVLIVGGEQGMGGAVALAGMAALRAGAGLVSGALRAPPPGGQAELMLHPVTQPAALAPLLARADVVAIGPGLGRSAWSEGMLDAALDSGHPLVIDADALNLLAARPRPCPGAVLTPHPGEAARLCATSTREIQADRFAAVRRIQAQFGAAAVVLKGRGTLVDDGAQVHVIDCGTPALATAGSGDVLTGVIAALRARGLDAAASATLGAWLHARAGERTAGGRRRGVIASDLLAHLQPGS